MGYDGWDESEITTNPRPLPRVSRELWERGLFLSLLLDSLHQVDSVDKFDAPRKKHVDDKCFGKCVYTWAQRGGLKHVRHRDGKRTALCLRAAGHLRNEVKGICPGFPEPSFIREDSSLLQDLHLRNP